MLADELLQMVVDFDRVERGGVGRKTNRYNLIVPEAPRWSGDDQMGVVIHHVAVRLNQAMVPVVKDVARIDPQLRCTYLDDLYYCGCAGWVVEWERRDACGRNLGEPGREWIRGSKLRVGTVPQRITRRGMLTFPWAPVVNPEALAATRYRYCGWKGGGGLADWLMVYNQDPKVEMLAKLGVSYLATPSVVRALRRPNVRQWFKSHLAELQRGFADPREFVWAAIRGASLEDARMHYGLVKEGRYYLSRVAKSNHVTVDYERLRKMLPKWKAMVADYARYLEFAAGLGMDLKCEGVLWPPVGSGPTEFHARLDRMERQHARMLRDRIRRVRAEERRRESDRRRELAELMAKRTAEIERFQRSVDGSLRLDLGRGVKVLLARSQDELREEGRRMHNCVGTGFYGEGIARGDSIILMFRLKGKSYCDAEIDRKTWKVEQCYIAHNAPAPDEYRRASEKIADHLKRMVKLAEASRCKRRRMVV